MTDRIRAPEPNDRATEKTQAVDSDPPAQPPGGAAAADPAPPTAAAAVDPAAELARESAEYKDRWLRALAEMENLRRRTERDVADARAYAISQFARDVVAVADNMQRALAALDSELREKADAGVKALLDGVELTERELIKALEKHGVQKLDPQGQKFDPYRHQAMFEVADETVPAGTVVQVVQAGYSIGERVLRPALVAVAKGGAKASPAPAEAKGSEAPANDNMGSASPETS